MSDTPKTDEAVIEGEFVEAPDGAASRRRRIWRWLPWALALLLAVFIAGLLVAPSVERQLRSLGLLAAPEATASASRERQAALAELRARLDALDGRLRVVETGLSGVSAEATALRLAQTQLAQRLSAQEAAPAADEDTAAALAALSARVEALEARLAQATAGAGSAPAAELQALEQRLAALEAARRAPPADLARHLLALGEAIETGRPFADTLAALEAEIAALPADRRLRLRAPLDALRPYAATGVASLSALKTGFDEIAAAVIRAASPPPEAGWWARLKDRLADLVIIRRKGAIEGTGIAARVARAEAALARDDPASAVAELEALDATARAPAETWLRAAHRYLAAKAALDRLIAASTAPRAASEE